MFNDTKSWQQHSKDSFYGGVVQVIHIAWVERTLGGWEGTRGSGPPPGIDLKVQSFFMRGEIMLGLGHTQRRCCCFYFYVGIRRFNIYMCMEKK